MMNRQPNIVFAVSANIISPHPQRANARATSPKGRGKGFVHPICLLPIFSLKNEIQYMKNKQSARISEKKLDTDFRRYERNLPL